MLPSMSKSLGKTIVAFLSIQAVAASPTTPVVEVTEYVSEVPNKPKANTWHRREAYLISPCYNGVTIGNGSPISAAKAFQYKSAPWFPNCANIADGGGEAKCFACMAVAGTAYYSAITGCTAGSAACAVGAWACESVCVAVATYALWTAEQACYCAHANCADAAQRNGGKIGGPPELTIAGQKFSLPMPSGWGYVGTRSVTVVPFGTPYRAIQCV